jgi:uncharacterized protein YndB with AHSA1/START domain/predicted enzyme related to lactoylglutathione lyase
MTVLQMTPCVLTERWSEFIEWSARVFDMPVACRFDEQGWGRLSASSPGVTVIDAQHFAASAGSRQAVVELEVSGIEGAIKRAVELGARLLTEPTEVGDGGWHAAIETPQEIALFLWEDRSSDDAEQGIHQGPVHFTVARQIDAPPEEVFAAATQAEHQEKFFVDDAKGDLDREEVITWTWDGYGEAEVQRLEFRPNDYVAFSWEGLYPTRVQFTVTATEDGARLAITESGWDADNRGLKEAFDHCEGWTQFLDNLKVYLEHGIER